MTNTSIDDLITEYENTMGINDSREEHISNTKLFKKYYDSNQDKFNDLQ